MNELFGLPLCKCGHEAEKHDDEFGNCMALPNPYGMPQSDGCDCEGYEEGEYEVPKVLM